MNKKHLLTNHNFNKFKKRIKEAENVLLFLDYDGTLAPFKTDPFQAFALPEIENKLNELKNNEKYFLNLVSGRKLSDLKKMIKLANSNFAGSHGLEIDLCFKKEIIYPHESSKIDSLSRKKYEKVKEKYSKSTEFKLVDKGFGLVIPVPEAEKQQELANSLLKTFKDTDYEILFGHKILEIRPRAWNKGDAVNYISRAVKEKFKLNDPLRIYIGDDSTDEDAFKVLENGIGIYVQNNSDLKTEADYFIQDPNETAKILNQLQE